MKPIIRLLLIPFIVLNISSCGSNSSKPSLIVESSEPSHSSQIIYSSEEEKEYYQLNEHYVEEALPTPGDETVDEYSFRLNDTEIHTSTQYAYLLSSYNKIAKYANGKKEASKSRPISIVAGEEEEDYDEYYIEISEYEDFISSLIYFSEGNYMDVYNSKVGTTYYYRGALTKDGLKNAQTYSFKVDNTLPRNLNVDGITNVRDLGGYKSKLGGVVRQGLYYRGGRLNKSDVDTLSIQVTEEGYNTLVNELGIKNEIDLRMNDSHYHDTHHNEFGYIDDNTFKDIKYNAFPMYWEDKNLMVEDGEMIGKVFKFLANADNYPVYLHCNIGTDRTGLVSYLLGTLIGIPQLDLYRDYLFSNFGEINAQRTISKITDTYLVALDSYNEENYYFAVRSYLKENGVTDEELDQIVNIFVDLEVKE